MKIKVEGYTYDYDPEELSIPEAVLLREHVGLDYMDLIKGDLNDPRFWLAMVWLCRTRDGEKKLLPTDVNVKFRDIEIIPDKPEPEAAAGNPTEATPSVSGSDSNSTVNGLSNGSKSTAATGSRSAKRST